MVCRLNPEEPSVHAVKIQSYHTSCSHLRYFYIQICWQWWLHTWWRHQMETFSTLLAICAGNSPVSGEFPAQRPVTRSFYVFFDLRMDGRLSKHSWGWWLDTLSCPLWRQSNEFGGSKVNWDSSCKVSFLQTGTKLSLLMHYRFLHGGTLCNIQTPVDSNESRVSQSTYIVDSAIMISNNCSIIASRTPC